MYSCEQAEWITERFLESREAYINLERYLRGDITQEQFNKINTFLIQSLHSDFKYKALVAETEEAI